MRCVMLDQDTIRCIFPPLPFAHEWVEYGLTPPEMLAEHVQDAQVVITNKVVFTRAILETLPDLKFIALCATGYNHIDVEACRDQGIGVANVRGYAVNTVPEHVFMLMLTLARRFPQYYTDVHQRNAWPRSSMYCLFDYPIEELGGRTLGIIGKGNLGEKVAHIARAFGMKVLFAEHKGVPKSGMREGYTLFETVLEESDIISLHCPLTPQTHHLINEETLRRMRPTALLINTGRGDLIDEHALVRALSEGWIAGAGLDVLSQEPPAVDHPIIQMRDHPRLLITPHNAWASDAAMQTVANQVIENITAFQEGRPLRRIV